MSSSTSRDEIRRRVGRYLGIKTDMSKWAASELAAVDDAIQIGLRWFYFPGGGHNWSFTKKQAQISLANGTTWYDLPTDFVSVLSPVSIATSKAALTQIDANQIRLKLVNEGATALPQDYGIRAKTDVHPQRYEIGFYPTPAASGTAEFWYVYDPGGLSDSETVPRGGPDHAETIVTACLAAAELELRPEALGEGGGIQFQRFQKLLTESIQRDQQLTKGMGA